MNNTKPLAILGASPAFVEPIHVGRPNIGDRQHLMARLNDMLDRRWLTNNGLYVQELERKLEKKLGVKHCIAMCNATVALEIVIRALELKGEVIIPSFTFIATAHALQWQEITPVFCDVDPATHNLDPRRVEELITPRTTGIIGVHLWGRSCDIESLAEIAHRLQLKLLFDAAHAFGCTSGGHHIGNFGNAEVFSFHATKFFNAFEGGAVTTNDDALAAKIRLMKNFGFSGYDNVIYIGTNGKMNEASAAMALTSLESMEIFITKNRNNHETYAATFANLPGLKLVRYDGSEQNNYQYVVLEVDESQTGLSRDELIKVLHAENVIARRYFYPGCHRMEPYRSFFPHARLLLPHTEALANRVLVLPTGTGIEEVDINIIGRVLGSAITQASTVHSRLQEVMQV